jgi:hypothetical protein
MQQLKFMLIDSKNPLLFFIKQRQDAIMAQHHADAKRIDNLFEERQALIKKIASRSKQKISRDSQKNEHSFKQRSGKDNLDHKEER